MGKNRSKSSKTEARRAKQKGKANRESVNDHFQGKGRKHKKNQTSDDMSEFTGPTDHDAGSKRDKRHTPGRSPVKKKGRQATQAEIEEAELAEDEKQEQFPKDEEMEEATSGSETELDDEVEVTKVKNPYSQKLADSSESEPESEKEEEEYDLSTEESSAKALEEAKSVAQAWKDLLNSNRSKSKSPAKDDEVTKGSNPKPAAKDKEPTPPIKDPPATSRSNQSDGAAANEPVQANQPGETPATKQGSKPTATVTPTLAAGETTPKQKTYGEAVATPAENSNANAVYRVFNQTAVSSDPLFARFMIKVDGDPRGATVIQRTLKSLVEIIKEVDENAVIVRYNDDKVPAQPFITNTNQVPSSVHAIGQYFSGAKPLGPGKNTLWTSARIHTTMDHETFKTALSSRLACQDWRYIAKHINTAKHTEDHTSGNYSDLPLGV